MGQLIVDKATMTDQLQDSAHASRHSLERMEVQLGCDNSATSSRSRDQFLGPLTLPVFKRTPLLLARPLQLPVESLCANAQPLLE